MQTVAKLALLLFTLQTTFAVKAQTPSSEQDNPKTWSVPEGRKIVEDLRHKLAGLPDYGVFDDLHFAVKGRALILEGSASRPILKSEAENAAKSVHGVESVINQIKVLPLSSFDDSIRAGVYRRIYSEPMLRKYTGSPVGFGRFPSVAFAAGGITNDPPIGYHAIHIIVDHGNVTLKGVVDNQTDASVAGMQANATPGAFSVDNDLQVADAGKQESK